MIKFRKFLSSFVIILLFFVMTSCSASNKDNGPKPSEDYIVMDFYKTIEIDTVQYTVYKPLHINFFKDLDRSALRYYYNEYPKIDNSDSNLTTWTLNYNQQVKDLFNNSLSSYTYSEFNKALYHEFYKHIEDSIKEYDINLGVTLDYYKNESELQKEFTVDMTREFSSVLIIDLYIPYHFTSEYHKDYYLHIPVKSFLAYKNDNTLTIIYDDKEKVIYYDTFISSQNVLTESDIMQTGGIYE